MKNYGPLFKMYGLIAIALSLELYIFACIGCCIKSQPKNARLIPGVPPLDYPPDPYPLIDLEPKRRVVWVVEFSQNGNKIAASQGTEKLTPRFNFNIEFNWKDEQGMEHSLTRCGE